jgi:hypothetical protein
MPNEAFCKFFPFSGKGLLDLLTFVACPIIFFDGGSRSGVERFKPVKIGAIQAALIRHNATATLKVTSG